MSTSTDAGTRWLDAEEMSAWRAYAETVVDLNAALEADLAPHGLTLGDYQVLVYLSEAAEHSMRMCDLAARLQLSPSGLTRRLDGLVRAGLVERRPSDQDRRVMLAVLNDHGLRVPRARSPRATSTACGATSSTASSRADVAAMARIFGAIRDGLHDDGVVRMTSLPDGFGCHVANVGVKDDTDDLVVIAAERPVAAAGVFTRSRFAGPSVTISREHLADRSAQAIVIVVQERQRRQRPGRAA